MNALLFTVCVALSAGAAETPGTVDPDAFQYHAPVTLGEAPQGFVRLMLTTEILDKLNPVWGDLRVADEQNRTVPYLLQRDTSAYHALARPVYGVCQGMTVLDDGTKAFLVDFGEPARKNRVDLQGWMHDPWPLRVEGSSDKQEWHGLLDADYRVQARLDAEGALSRWLQLEEGKHRWLRVVYAADKAPSANTFTMPVLADYVPDSRESGLVLAAMTRVEPVAASAAPRPGWTAYEWAVNCRNLPVASTRFVVDDPYFSRQFTFEGSDDGKHWTEICAGMLKRTQWEKHAVDALSLLKGYVTPARLRLTVNDGDNPPLSVQVPELWGRTGQLCFDISGKKTIMLYFGNAGMAAPKYDLAQSVKDLRLGSLPELKPGSTELRPPKLPKPVEKPVYSPPYLLWGIMAVAVCVMLAIVLGAMGTMTRAEHKEQNSQGEGK